MRARFDDGIRFHRNCDHAHCLTIAAQFCQQTQVVLARVRVAGDVHHDKRFAIDQRFWSQMITTQNQRILGKFNESAS